MLNLDSYEVVNRHSPNQQKRRLASMAALSLAALVIAAVLLAGSLRSGSRVALAQNSQYGDEMVVEKFDELTHKVRPPLLCAGRAARVSLNPAVLDSQSRPRPRAHPGVRQTR